MLNTFIQLDSILTQFQSLWRFEPFHLSYTANATELEKSPALQAWLLSLDESQISHYKDDTPSLLSQMSQHLPELACLTALTELPASNQIGLSLPKGADAGIPGRKLSQIVAMGQASIATHQGKEWLEWCSGKGFLGRLLALKTGQVVTSFEWQQALCDAGQAEADKKQLPMRFVQGDALSQQAGQVMSTKQHAVALHACGDLHVRLIEHGCKAGVPAFTIAPCCYHLIQDSEYQAMSKPGLQSRLKLTKSELRIPLQSTVTGGERVRRHRRLEMSYRLGLDCYLREAQGHASYTPLPSIKKSQLALGFEHFCLWAAKCKSLEVTEMDYAYWLKRGEQRFVEMERLSLAQQVFQRSLELWLVLDRALFLVEQGYLVSLSEFCSYSDTPRNILIQANRIEQRQ